MSMDDPRTHAEREAAQRADEAELLALDSLPRIPAVSTHPNGIMGAVLEYLDPALYAEKFTRADEAELQAGLLAPLPPMAGGSEAPRCPDCGDSGAARDCEPCVLAPPSPMAGGASTCFYCEHHGDGAVPATRQITFVDNDAPRTEWVCDECARTYFPDVLRSLPPIADDPAGPGATRERTEALRDIYRDLAILEDKLGEDRFAELGLDGVLSKLDAVIGQASLPRLHTHPCPTCRHDRSCTCTVFVPGEPLECATCSNCRGW